MKKLGIVVSRHRFNQRGWHLVYGHGFGFAKWLPYRLQRLIVHPVNKILCAIYGHAWTFAEQNGEVPCCDCSKRRPATQQELEWAREASRKIERRPDAITPDDALRFVQREDRRE